MSCGEWDVRLYKKWDRWTITSIIYEPTIVEVVNNGIREDGEYYYSVVFSTVDLLDVEPN